MGHFVITLFVTCLLVAFARTQNNSVVNNAFGTDGWWNDFDGGANNYTMYDGDGSTTAGWPARLHWISFNDMWIANAHLIARSCDLLYNQSHNSPQETNYLYGAIKKAAQQTRMDHRFIFAAVMQETKGCVRASSSVSSDGIHNPGLLQDFKGTHSCNDNGKVQNPCPQSEIIGMIMDGVVGIPGSENSFAQNLNAQAGNVSDSQVAQAYYRAARLYNSGAIDPSGDLGKGSATHCYGSDIANRLMGCVDAPTACTLDGNSTTTA